MLLMTILLKWFGLKLMMTIDLKMLLSYFIFVLITKVALGRIWNVCITFVKSLVLLKLILNILL